MKFNSMKSHSIRVSRRVDHYMLRNLCVKYELFTRGDTDEYSRMLEEAENYNDSNVEELAQYILEHSRDNHYPLDYIAYVICTEAMRITIDWV